MNKLSDKIADLTREEWKNLGFYYISDQANEKWELHGSRTGLSNLCNLLRKFASENREYGDHEHLMPHWYLTFTSLEDFSINKRDIGGKPEQLMRFANFFEKEVSDCRQGATVTVPKDAFNTDYEITFTVHRDNFDPSSKDPQL
ncbi:hypothetical protein KJ365_02775 [Glaciecola sp. XM2]|jgi:hypothetical protein|uniref:Imm32 family immunity protein n=1 Tax=Glaciecola sp. XM2 TaxID=1914931 RepID=UPI001BDE69EA|nr:hypothetical protein [Glaciecola sp. XM2]MBT1449790.1 hypothetical protein [Glaciecola sp. XM2]